MEPQESPKRPPSPPQVFPTDDSTDFMRWTETITGIEASNIELPQAVTPPLISSSPLISIPFEEFFEYYSSLDKVINTQQQSKSNGDLLDQTNATTLGTPIAFSSMGIQQGDPKLLMNVPSSSNLNPVSRGKRKISWEDGNAPRHIRSWSSLLWGNGGQSFASFHTSTKRYSLYDPRYEEQGVPVDPHIRILNSKK